mmetsp:Transcript_26475/g.72783  ORF Transcript_26475/g.72783 Transcript_26475/m.72783 type:complete len:200 (+) Transcript_26475:1215-1814(+)
MAPPAGNIPPGAGWLEPTLMPFTRRSGGPRFASCCWLALPFPIKITTACRCLSWEILTSSGLAIMLPVSGNGSPGVPICERFHWTTGWVLCWKERAFGASWTTSGWVPPRMPMRIPIALPMPPKGMLRRPLPPSDATGTHTNHLPRPTGPEPLLTTPITIPTITITITITMLIPTTVLRPLPLLPTESTWDRRDFPIIA